MSDFKELKVWQRAHALTIATFRNATRMKGPGAAMLRNQWLRAIVSVPANIAEGSAKYTDPDYVRFLRIALGSLTECEYYAILARDLSLISATEFEKLASEAGSVGRMLNGLIRALKDNDRKTQP